MVGHSEENFSDRKVVRHVATANQILTKMAK